MRLKWLICVAAVMTAVMVGCCDAVGAAGTGAARRGRSRRRRRPWSRIQSSAAVDDDRCVSRWRHRAAEVRWPRRRAAWLQVHRRARGDDELRDHLPRHRRRAAGRHRRRVALDGVEHPGVGRRHSRRQLPDGHAFRAHITGQPVYMGPGAPAGPRYHHYVFELYALNANLDLPPTREPRRSAEGDGGKDHGQGGVRRSLSQRNSSSEITTFDAGDWRDARGWSAATQ